MIVQTSVMLKLFGAVLIILAGTAIGFVQAASYVNRSKQLRLLIYSLQRLETEINYGQTFLPTALIKSSEGMEQPLSKIFTETAQLLEDSKELSMQEAWQQTIENVWGHTALRQREKDVLLRMGTVLGMSDAEDQQKHLQLAQLQLKSEEEQAVMEQQRYANMWRSLGTLGAILIVILMV
ncbi:MULTISPECIES: stage III sporulation protein SpoIIIAB [Paenibacillus]|uniref:stage III sporulation protein SpoIIIAB n=1 Tax=Paenibacillus TaxID=44249 RepID=UPI00203BEBDF|nr:stage III sporulation protein SpoIIIAB [Paenibacillus camelliae]MCM3633178.1 stage III sporulation protein SpoIIIAB [Paenibacillus camelliae]